jgi:hypothetical protein
MFIRKTTVCWMIIRDAAQSGDQFEPLGADRTARVAWRASQTMIKGFFYGTGLNNTANTRGTGGGGEENARPEQAYPH